MTTHPTVVRRETQQDAERRVTLREVVFNKLLANGPLTAETLLAYVNNDPRLFFTSTEVEIVAAIDDLRLRREVALYENRLGQPPVYIARRFWSRDQAVEDDVLDVLKQGPGDVEAIKDRCNHRLHPSLDKTPSLFDVVSAVQRLTRRGLVHWSPANRHYHLPKGAEVTTANNLTVTVTPDRTYRILHSLATAGVGDNTDSETLAKMLGEGQQDGVYPAFDDLIRLSDAGLIRTTGNNGRFSIWAITDAGKVWLKDHLQGATAQVQSLDSKTLLRTRGQAQTDLLSLADSLRTLVTESHRQFKEAERRLDRQIDTYYSREFPDRVADVVAAAAPLLEAKHQFESMVRAGIALQQVADELQVVIVPDLFPPGT